jgi:hypothetical protein
MKPHQRGRPDKSSLLTPTGVGIRREDLSIYPTPDVRSSRLFGMCGWLLPGGVPILGSVMEAECSTALRAFCTAERVPAPAGQLVLLFHWSMLNYAALVKILKKHGTLSPPHAKCLHAPHALIIISPFMLASAQRSSADGARCCRQGLRHGAESAGAVQRAQAALLDDRYALQPPGQVRDEDSRASQHHWRPRDVA